MDKRHSDMLGERLDYDSSVRMNDWEVEFLESLNRLPKHVRLTEKQAITLGNIWDKVFG